MKAWVKLPLDALKRSGGITKAGVVVLSVMVDEAAKKHKTDGVEMTVQEIADKAGCNERTVRRALEALEVAELIAHRRTGRASSYTLTGAVELYPEGTFDGSARAGGKKPKWTKKPSAKEEAEMSEYLSLVNRFKEESDRVDAYENGDQISGQGAII